MKIFFIFALVSSAMFLVEDIILKVFDRDISWLRIGGRAILFITNVLSWYVTLFWKGF